MAAAPQPTPREPQAAPPTWRERHLRLVEPPAPAPTPDAESRRLRETRWITGLVAVATVAVIALSIAGIFGAADAAWWPFLIAGVFMGLVALGVVAYLRIR